MQYTMNVLEKVYPKDKLECIDDLEHILENYNEQIGCDISKLKFVCEDEENEQYIFKLNHNILTYNYFDCYWYFIDKIVLSTSGKTQYIQNVEDDNDSYEDIQLLDTSVSTIKYELYPLYSCKSGGPIHFNLSSIFKLNKLKKLDKFTFSEVNHVKCYAVHDITEKLQLVINYKNIYSDSEHNELNTYKIKYNGKSISGFSDSLYFLFEHEYLDVYLDLDEHDGCNKLIVHNYESQCASIVVIHIDKTHFD
jgi:hypothetical protein